MGMAGPNALIVASFILSAFIWSSLCEDPLSTTDPDDDESSRSDLSFQSPEKRQHSIMRFGKRPAGSGHQLIHFGKRIDGKNSRHGYLFFGKRSRESDSKIPELLQYLQRSQESSWKRGHNIMRFGKRGNGNDHNIIRFGKRDDMLLNEGVDALDDISELPDEDANEDSKRNGHAMMYFGKRGGHSMLYFGKRGGHSMVHFGKRDPYADDYFDTEDSLSEAKRGPHSMIHFGKRGDLGRDISDDKRAHSMIHFGKRLLEGNEDEKKNEDNDDEFYLDIPAEEEKRGQHSMIHFGKRTEDADPDEILRWIHPNGPLAAGTKRYHSLMRFGKRPLDGYPPIKGSHSMIHFGKRDGIDKKAHSMIHFGKRSIVEDFEKDQESVNISSLNDKNLELEKAPSSEKSQYLKRQKRQTINPGSPVVTLVHYLPETLQENQPSESALDDYDTNDESYLGNLIRSAGYFGNENIPLIFPKQIGGGDTSGYSDFYPPEKKQNPKNVFLRFGKR